MFAVRIIIALLCLTSQALAGGRGGHNTTFDPNSYGGGWTTITCDGTLADNAAYVAWRTAAAAANPALAKLRLVPSAPGIYCSTGGEGANNALLTQGIQNVIIWGYGATVSAAYIGGTGFQSDASNTNSAIQTVSAGSSTVTLVTAGQISRYSVGDWIAVAGLSLQNAGYPPNFQFFEFRLITAINGATITLNKPLTQDFLSTWPSMTVNGGTITAGPAMIYKMGDSWNTNIKILGLTVGVQLSQTGVIGRAVHLSDMVFLDGDGLTVTASENVFIDHTSLNSSELDKAVELLVLDRSWGNLLLIQSSSINKMTISNSKFFGSLSGLSVVGTSKDVDIINSYLGVYKPGQQYGVGNSLLLDGVYAVSPGGGNAPTTPLALPIASVSYSSGTITIPNASSDAYIAWAWGVPGYKYYIGGTHGDFGTPLTGFTITAVTQDGTNTYFATGSWTQAGSSIATPAVLPSVTCGVVGCPSLVSYIALTIKQINSVAGSDDFTQYQAP